MDDQKFRTFYNQVSAIFMNAEGKHGNRARWQLAFGTLLYFVRDRAAGKPYTQDFDISMHFDDVNQEKLVACFDRYGFTLKGNLKSGIPGKSLHMSFAPTSDNMRWAGASNIDIFFWYEASGKYWHCYEVRDGKFIMKGIDKNLLDGRAWRYYWYDDLLPCYLPRNYGHCLDFWYPGWMIPMPRFGTSMTKYIVPVGQLKALGNPKVLEPAIQASRLEYDTKLNHLLEKVA